MFFYIPGEIISILTFPGIIVHEIAHRLFCDIAKVPVYAVCYFRVGKTAGYVIHAPTKNIAQSFFISYGPFFINTLLCTCLLAFPLLSYKYAHQSHALLTMGLGWLGFSIGAHAIPSKTDVSSFVDNLNKSDLSILLSMPLYIVSGILFMFSFLTVVWFDFIYSYLLGFLGCHLACRFL